MNPGKTLSSASLSSAVLACALLLVQPARAAPQPAPRQPSAAELLRAIERLAVVGNVLFVAAHPDDENTRLLAYLGGERLLRAAYLSLTRGDGGQNLIGPEQGPLLGLIRTQELLAARRVDGAEQLFTRARDFGYSKSPAETLAIWGKEEVLADVVLQVRRFRPDVIITRFMTSGMETHGHHTASAMLAQEAFKAAADPAFHPEQLRLFGPWQARRLLWNRFSFGDKPGADQSSLLAGLLRLDSGAYNPVLGLSYGEVSADSRSMHKSQGFGSARSRSPNPEYFLPLPGDSPWLKDPATSKDPLAGLDLSWGRVAGAGRLAQLLQEAAKGFDAHHPEASIPILLQARAELLRLPDNPFKDPKLRELADVIAACAGLYLEASASDFSVVPGGSLKVSITALNRSSAALALQELHLPGATENRGASRFAIVNINKALQKNQPLLTERALAIPADAPLSDPYWLAAAPQAGLYTVSDADLIGQPESPAALRVEFLLRAGDQTLALTRPVVYKWTDPVAGERTRAIEISPPVTLNVAAPVLMFPDAQPRALRVRVAASMDGARGVVRLELPAGFSAEPATQPIALARKGDEIELRFQLRPPALAGPAPGVLRVVAEINGARADRGLTRIDYPHIPIQTVFPEAAVRLVRFDLKQKKTRVGYIPGAGDEVPAALRQVGYEVSLLDDEALASQPLSRYGAIVIGVRAYNTNPRLPVHHQRLMDYVAAGGALLVQYNTNNRIGRLSAPIGPYPFEISQDRVTDEGAAVTVSDHPLLQRPNRISAADFSGWVQERGLYFAGTWSDKYQAPLAMNDPGEEPRKGSLIVARHGKGTFIYTGLAFFRQLPAGVPGAYRLFANLLAAGSLTP